MTCGFQVEKTRHTPPFKYTAPIMRFVGVMVLVQVMSWVPSAHAAGKESKERAARKACLSGDYAKGVAILSDLFIQTEDANYIFNQARCFEQNSRCEEAIGRFREFLRKVTAITPADKADTEKHIAECQDLLGQKRAPAPTSDSAVAVAPKTEAAPPAPAAPSAAASPPPAATSPPPVTPSPPPAVASPPPAAVSPATPVPEQFAVATSAPPAANPGRGLRIAGIACGVLGVASVGTAIYYYAQAKSYSDKVSGQTPPNPSDESAGKNAQTMQWVFYSVGAAAIASGTVLYVLGWRQADTSRGMAGIAPMLGPGLAGISAQGAF
jgi:hypothetical protein